MFKRLLCILAAVLIPCAALAEYTMAGYDEANTYRTWSTNKFFSRMEELTGVKFTYQQYTKAEDWEKAKAAMQADSARHRASTAIKSFFMFCPPVISSVPRRPIPRS